MAKQGPMPMGDVEDWFKATHCGGCQAARLLHWVQEERSLSLGYSDTPQHAVDVADHWAVVHCDYFRRRVEQPDKLTFCGARRSG